MKQLFLIGLVFGALLHPARATDYFLFKLSASLPVVRVNAGKIETKTLTAKEIVNLALGREIKHAIDAKKEILALAASYSDDPFVNETPASTKVVIFDSTTGQMSPTPIMTGNSLFYEVAYTNTNAKGQGFGEVKIEELGDANVGKLYTTTLKGGALGVGIPGANKPAGGGAATAVSGSMKFTFTDKSVTQTYEGLVIKGMFKTSGPLILVVVP